MSAPKAADMKPGDRIRDITDPDGVSSYVKIGQDAWVRLGDPAPGTTTVPIFADAFIHDLLTRPVTDRAAQMLLRRIREISGLSDAQIARTLGVHTRTIHHWLSTGRPPTHRIGTIINVHTAISLLDGNTPEERRRQLLDSSGGRSILTQMILDAPEGELIQVEPLTVRERLGL